MSRKLRRNRNQISSDSSDPISLDTIIQEESQSQSLSLPSISSQSLTFQSSTQSAEQVTPSLKRETTEKSISKSHVEDFPNFEDENIYSRSTPIVPRENRKRRRRISKSQSLEEESSIYFLIKSNHSPLEIIVDNWNREYKISREHALLKLLQFFISSTGCAGRITLEMQNMMSNRAIINRMIEEFDDETGIYPFTKTGSEWKDFRKNTCLFVRLLIAGCHKNEIIYDKYFMEKVVSFLIELSTSKIRTFRHTSTLISLKIITTLIDLQVELTEDLNKIRQTAKEGSVTTSRFLSGEKDKLKEQLTVVGEKLCEMFESIFTVRFKDIFSGIRVICMEEIGLWIQKLPDTFLDDNFLKYIGWMLSDSDGEVRLKCLEALKPNYASGSEKLRNFTRKFKSRLISMTHDKKHDVALEALKIINIWKYQPEILNDADNERIFELVFYSHQPIARLAGKFLKKRLFNATEAIADNESSEDERQLMNTSAIQNLVIFFNEAELPEYADSLVDSLIESSEVMKDWECMTNLLLEKENSTEEFWNDEMATSLSVIMISCIKQATTGKIPEHRGFRRKMTGREEQQFLEEKQRMTKHFIKVLPNLLSHYNTNLEKLVNLLVIPQYFDLNVYTDLHEEEHLDSLLFEIMTIIKMVNDSKVLEIGVKSLEYLCTEGHAIFTKCDTLRSNLIDMIVQTYKACLEDYKIAVENRQDLEEFLSNLTQCLKKIATFYTQHDLNPWKIWDSLFENMINSFLETSPHLSLPDEVVKDCLTSCYFSLLWGQRHLLDWIDSDVRGDEESLLLKEHLHAFMELNCKLFSAKDIRTPVSSELRESAYTAFCDLLAIFCNQLKSHPNPLMHRLIYEMNPQMEIALHNFLDEFVFLEKLNEELSQNSRWELLKKRRDFLASYCKLIVYNMLPMKAGAQVFKNYGKFFKEYGDLIKETLMRARGINRINWALTVQYSLNILFEELLAKRDKIDRKSREFLEIRELATKFALLFGQDEVKNKNAISALQKAGIQFVFSCEFDAKTPPRNISFLEILLVFTTKLSKDNRVLLLKFLEDCVEIQVKSLQSADWQPFILYRNKLLEANNRINSRKSKTNARPRKAVLPITEIKLPRRRTAEYSGLMENEISPMPSIEDSSLSSDISEKRKNSQFSSRMEMSSIEESDHE